MIHISILSFPLILIQFHSMQEIVIKDEFIKLGQLIKLAGIADSGLDAKIFIQDGEVSVNGETETRRGRKLYDGDEVTCFDNHVIVKCSE